MRGDRPRVVAPGRRPRRRHPDVRATVGLHPHDASHLAEQWAELEALARDRADVVVAIGETGFDLFYEHSPRDEQEAAFRAQIRLAHRLDRALVIHSRDAWDDTFRVLADEGVPARTVFHCFTGGPDEGARALDLGAYLSFSGIVTFKNADDVRGRRVRPPRPRCWSRPTRRTSRRCPTAASPTSPAWVVDVGTALAAATGIPTAELAAATRHNAPRCSATPLTCWDTATAAGDDCRAGVRFDYGEPSRRWGRLGSASDDTIAHRSVADGRGGTRSPST